MRTITLNELAQEAHVHPKEARQRLRNLGDNVPARVRDHRWIFQMKDRRRVLRLIKK